jgi:hypothetical protein
MNWHYSRAMPVGKLARFGVWENGRYAGAVIFGRGATAYLLLPYGLDQTEGAELVRVALRNHVAPVSQIVSRAVRMLRAESPGLRLVVSFADPAQGHAGVIYQAGNWMYLGTTVPARYFVVNGVTMHPRSVGAVGWVQSVGWLRANVDPAATTVTMPGKHRYVLPLDRAMRRQVAGLAQPYPRGRGVDGDTPADPAGGASSTLADRSIHSHAQGYVMEQGVTH